MLFLRSKTDKIDLDQFLTGQVYARAFLKAIEITPESSNPSP